MENMLKEQILQAEEQLRLAMINSDIAGLDQLLAPELLFTNHQGQLVGKQQDLEAHAAGIIKISSITLAEQQILPTEGAVIVSTSAKISGNYSGNPASGNFRFTRVWSPSPNGGWWIVAGHSCLIA